LIAQPIPLDPFWRSRCAVVIPCRDEARTIADLVVGVRAYLPKVIVVDDGSHDATAAEALDSGADLIALPEPLGKGAALICGWKRAADLGFSWAVTMDGDGQHSPNDLPLFFQDAQPDEPALVIGNRMLNAQAMPWLRRQVNRWMSKRLSRRTGTRLPDSQCGFRLLHLPSLSRMALATKHFEIESELILASVRLRIPIKFVPIQVIYKGGPSKINPVLDSLRWFRWFFRTGV
jgi:glycosyltransferase involved in cell wall biosynthesis